MVFFLYEKCIFKHTFKFIPSNFVSYIETHLLSKSAFKVMVYIFFFGRDTNNKTQFAELYICTKEQ